MSSLDRRSFLFGKRKEGAATQESPTEKTASIERRHFLAGLAAVALMSGQKAGAQELSVPKEAAHRESSRPLLDTQEYGATALEAGLVFLANTAIEQLFDPFIRAQFGFSLGNANTEQVSDMLKSKPFQTFFSETLLKPVTEEGLFRLFPAILLKEWFGSDFNFGKGPSAWLVGIPVTFLFAAQHNVTNEGFDTEHIPLSQFMGGLFLWHLMRTKGIDHAVLAHSAYNAAFVGVAVPLHRRFP